MNKSIERLEIEGVIEKYYEKFNLPPENISENVWDAFYDILAKHFKRKGIINEYLNALNIIIRRALFYASFKENKTFNITHLLKAIDDLCAFNIYEKERNKIKNELINVYNQELEENKTKKKIII